MVIFLIILAHLQIIYLELGPRANFSPQSVFASLFETEPGPFIYIFSVAAFMLLEQSRITATETTWPVKPKILNICPFADKIFTFFMLLLYFMKK